MEQVEYIAVNKLKPHPRNDYFFNNISGGKWGEFLDSISTIGIKDPLLITQDNVIVSGHQRLRAAKRLRMAEVPCIRRQYDSEDEILRDLIELNIRQRGAISDCEVMAGRRFKELKRIYGIKSGNNQRNKKNEYNKREEHDVPSSKPTKTADQLARENDVTRQQINRTIQTADSDPRLQEWNISGKTSGDAIRYIMSNMTQEEINDFINKNEDIQKVRKSDAVEYLAEKKKLQDEIYSLKTDVENKDAEIAQYKNDSKTINNAAFLELSKVEVSRAVNEADSVYDLAKETYEYFLDRLAPIKFSREMGRAIRSPTVKENMFELVDTINDWCKEMYMLLNSNSEIIDS